MLQRGHLSIVLAQDNSRHPYEDIIALMPRAVAAMGAGGPTGPETVDEPNIRVTVKTFSAVARMSTGERKPGPFFETRISDEITASQRTAKLNRFFTEIFSAFYAAPHDFAGMVLRLEVARRMGDFMLEVKPHTETIPRHDRKTKPEQTFEPFRNRLMGQLLVMLKTNPNLCHFCPGGPV